MHEHISHIARCVWNVIALDDIDMDNANQLPTHAYRFLGSHVHFIGRWRFRNVCRYLLLTHIQKAKFDSILSNGRWDKLQVSFCHAICWIKCESIETFRQCTFSSMQGLNYFALICMRWQGQKRHFQFHICPFPSMYAYRPNDIVNMYVHWHIYSVRDTHTCAYSCSDWPNFDISENR